MYSVQHCTAYTGHHCTVLITLVTVQVTQLVQGDQTTVCYILGMLSASTCGLGIHQRVQEGTEQYQCTVHQLHIHHHQLQSRSPCRRPSGRFTKYSPDVLWPLLFSCCP